MRTFIWFKWLLRINVITLFVSCSTSNEFQSSPLTIRSEKINRYHVSQGEPTDSLVGTRITYYFDNGLEQSWIETDGMGRLMTEYIGQYDGEWILTGAMYREEGASTYSKELVSFQGNQKTTQWVDTTGTVYYSMIDALNESGETYRATFIGDTIHGYDSTFYTENGFVSRIFFTNNKGKIFNDRSFEYLDTNDRGDWTNRQKIMDEQVVEIHQREINYEDNMWFSDGKFYPEVISTSEMGENMISFSQDDQMVVFTRYQDWEEQTAWFGIKRNGIIAEVTEIRTLGTLYNASVSPSGNKMLYAVRGGDQTDIWMAVRMEGSWQIGNNITASTGVSGGYFNWIHEGSVVFYVPENNGDIVMGSLSGDELVVDRALEEFNTVDGTEFSPFIDAGFNYLIFTRYLEGDTTQQGFFISENLGTGEVPGWNTAAKIKSLPYGWGTFVSSDQKRLTYTDGDDIYAMRTADIPMIKSILDRIPKD